MEATETPTATDPKRWHIEYIRPVDAQVAAWGRQDSTTPKLRVDWTMEETGQRWYSIGADFEMRDLADDLRFNPGYLDVRVTRS